MLQIGCPEIAHAALNASDEAGEHPVERTGLLLKRLDSLGGHLAGGVGFLMTVTGGAACLHGGEATHATVLFVELATDLDHLSGGLGATGQDAAADDALRQGESLDDVARFGDAAVGKDGDFFCRRCLGADMKGGHLRDTDTGHDAGGADRTGPLSDLDDAGTAVGEKFNPRGACDITCNDRKLGESVAEHPDRVADTLGVTMGGGDRHHVEASVDESPDMTEDAIAIKFAEGIAGGGDGGAADETELRITGRLELGLALLGDLLHIAHGDEAVETILVVDHEELVDADVLGEELIREGDRVVTQLPPSQRVHLRTGSEGL